MNMIRMMAVEAKQVKKDCETTNGCPSKRAISFIHVEHGWVATD